MQNITILELCLTPQASHRRADSELEWQAMNESAEDRLRTDSETLDAALVRLDSGTRDHSLRVSRYSAILAETLGVPPAQSSIIGIAAKFHEIGKLAIPEAILYKPAKLTAEEQAVLREYPLHGYEMVRHVPSLAEAAEIVYSHRERFDGTGYPRGLKGEAIPLAARIVAVADTFDMFISERPHRREQAITAARAEIRRWSGSCFDPRVLESFTNIPIEMWENVRTDSQES